MTMPRRIQPCGRLVLALVLVGFVQAPAAADVGAVDPDGAGGGADERYPVLLVPGWGDEAEQLEPLRERLLQAGWGAGALEALTFSDPVGSNQRNAREVAAAVEALLGRTESGAIDIVAHSMGGLAVREYLRDAGPSVPIRRVVFLGTPHRGTLTAALAWGEGGREMVPGSDFLDRLNASGADGGSGVEALSIRTPVDLSVIPSSSAMLPGASNVEVCCPTHQGLLDDPKTFEILHAFLLTGTWGEEEPDGTIPLRTPAGWWQDGGRGG